MLKFIAVRVLFLIPIIIGVTFISFVLLHIAPGDPAQLIAGEGATAADIDAVRVKLGLDKPLLVQYAIYFFNICQGDLGVSIRTQRTVFEEVMARYPATIELAGAAVVIASIIGLIAGIIAASH